MTGLPRMAWRNLWRNKRRTVLTLVSIAFGFFFVVLMSAMMDRSFADFIDTAARLGSGHVALQHPEYLDTPTLTRRVTGVDALRSLALADPDVERVTVRVQGQVMISSTEDAFGALFIAYDPADEDTDTFAFLDARIDGEAFRTSRDKGILLGTILAKNLGVGLGDKVVYTLLDRNGEIVSSMARVRGIVDTGTPGLDAGICLLPLDTLREAIGYGPDEASRVAVYLDDQRHSGGVARRLQAAVGSGVAAVPWSETSPELSAFVAMKIGGARFMEAVLALLVVAGIFNTLFVSVMERLREFGILIAVGFSPGRIFRLVMWESLWLALVGLVVGIAITALPYRLLAERGIDLTAAYGSQKLTVTGVGFDPVLRIGIFPETLVVILVAVLLTTLVAGLWPAWKAGRVDPVETIRLV